uniref:HYR domain-containing protein n=1 Tax=Chromera velia CCMP2878 TaxID=1169474 RepID=A0A0K6S9B1_9ALVE|eukprot:Cvel_6951.t1-p1 / transcript=Cvel_6951.t1 / gene=Cvel_6951 / organism=Chromera_velia_CCMP2878 / gene_product=hypothetical protein / transcript_product=hypothetical protein / location=Cvel_scaffold352:62421-65283(+) / protein_length=337 / sequence_SO=supercontig / SO=protein_coding / is_pseudo=false
MWWFLSSELFMGGVEAITCPSSQVVSQVGDAGVAATFTATLGAGESSVTYSTDSGSLFNEGAHTVTATTDIGTSCSFFVFVAGCPPNSQRSSATGSCTCDAGYWQDLSVSILSGRLPDTGVASNGIPVVCTPCISNSTSDAGSTHPSACYCLAGFYILPYTTATDGESGHQYWTDARCEVCPVNAQCSEGLIGSGTDATVTISSSTTSAAAFAHAQEEDPSALSSALSSNEVPGPSDLPASSLEALPGSTGSPFPSNSSLTRPRRLQTSTTETRFTILQHIRPMPSTNYALVSNVATAEIKRCPVDGTCQSGDQSVFQESETGAADCVSSMRGVSSL